MDQERNSGGNGGYIIVLGSVVLDETRSHNHDAERNSLMSIPEN